VPAPVPASPTGAHVVDLTEWLAAVCGRRITTVWVIRTSNKSKREFEAMFQAGVALDPTHPDVVALRAHGHALVMPDGADTRRQLGVMELRTGSVPGHSGRGGRALLAYLVPLGASLFVLYFDTARKADMRGPTKDQSKNYFTEALCEIIRRLRPKALHTPIFNRLVRNTDFGALVLRALREYDVTLFADGKEIPLKGSENQLLRLLETWFAARDASDTVRRLAGVEASIYKDGQWYLTEKLLPFVWRPKQEIRRNPLTAEPETIVPDSRDFEIVPGAVAVFDAWVTDLKNPQLTLADIGVELGKRGVRSRAPKHFADPPTLDKLQQPAHAVTTLLQDRWLRAYLTGTYTTQVRLKDDIRDNHPELADHVIQITDDNDEVEELRLEVTVHLPMPERGHLLDGPDYDAVLAVRKAPTPQRIGRAASSGDRRPLSSLCQYLEDQAPQLNAWHPPLAVRQIRLGTFDSSQTYTVLWRPLERAADGNGTVLGWTKEDRCNKLAAVNCAVLHEDIGNVLVWLAEQLEGLVAPLRRVDVVREAADRKAQQARNQIQAEIEELEPLAAQEIIVREALTGNPDALAAYEAAGNTAVRNLENARSRLTALQADIGDAGGVEQAVEQTAMADLGTLELVGVALRRVGPFAPAELNELLLRLFGNSLRVAATADGLGVIWQAQVRIPLTDGTIGVYDIGSSAPLRGIAWTKRVLGATGPDWQEMLARQFFDEGMSYAELGELRGLDGSGRGDSYLVKTLRQWLRRKGVEVDVARLAAMDAPEQERQMLARLLRTGEPQTRFEQKLLAWYLDPEATWTSSWASEDGDLGRAVLAVVEQLGGAGVPAVTVAKRLGITWKQLVAVSSEWQPLWPKGRTAPGYVERNWLRGSVPALGALLSTRRCEHDDCLGLLEHGTHGVLLRAPFPTVEPHYQLCRDCRRQPGDSETVYPDWYVLPWRGGRKQTRIVDGERRILGTHLAV
jgi:hypothetical protein